MARFLILFGVVLIVVGLLVHQVTALHDALSSPLLTGCMLPVTGAMLLWVTRCPPGQVDYTEMSYRQALVIGVCQAVVKVAMIFV